MNEHNHRPTAALMSAIFMAAIIAPARAANVGSGEPPRIEDDELTVLAAAVKQLHLDDSPRWFMLADRTLSFACEPPSVTGFSMGACNGMKVAGQSAEDALTDIRDRIPGVTTDLTSRFATRTAASVAIDRALPLPVRQVIWGPTSKTPIPEGLGNPDFAAYPSRVGFDPQRNAALVYLAVMNWTDSSKSFGGYVYLVKSGTEWLVKGEARTWQLAP